MRNTTVDVSGEDVPGYIAFPAAGSGKPVIVIQEWWGLVPHIVDVCDRFARAGFVALAVDHYRGMEATEPDEAQKLMLGLNIEQAGRDLAAAADDLLRREGVEGERVSVTGFCMGGGLALLAPTLTESICCTAAWYPAMPWPQYAPDWGRYAGKSALVHKAQSDEDWAGAKIAEYAAAIAASGGTVEVDDYPGSVHAFFNDARPEVHQPGNAALAWDRTLSLFRGCA